MLRLDALQRLELLRQRVGPLGKVPETALGDVAVLRDERQELSIAIRTSHGTCG